ncbi:hypothetical protein CANINC_001033 [Pichia inconspicua]|uniref:Endonuclease/exonuclease/phosphatase domain-containing protein n=1 Tax=Pichia inconspicua TaxID=52247 RepID=A0A4T0X4F8_9ASCO|nr:hypothetical protein CANINC_001033 [[Candida] inconspicua]
MDFKEETDKIKPRNTIDNLNKKELNTDDLIVDVASITIKENDTKTSKKKKKKDGKIPKELITPEYIEMKRREREENKKLKREALLAQGIDPDADFKKPLYIKRELLTIPHENEFTDEKTITLKLMTYNLLAQALIRRTLFPDNGDILKWQKRSKVLLKEIKDYDCDIMCLQEVDFVQYKTFWRPELEKLGYHTKFNRGGDKNHGVSIFYKWSLFNIVDTCMVDFDREKSGDIRPQTITKNAGLIVALKIKSNPKKAIIIGTAHLFWHPFGTFERTRQTYIVLSKCKEFEKRVKILHPEIEHIWNFFAGDFNSQPYDAPYLSICKKPIKYDSRCKKVISCSTSFQYSSKRNGGSGEEEEGGNIEKFGENQPKDPVPETFEATKEQEQLVNEIEKLHNSLPLRAVSLYSVAYKQVDPLNSGLDNDRNEPFFSNWAYSWRGLLDYIFLIRDWDINEDKTNVDSLSAFESENHVRLNKLLRMPHKDEMSLGQPRESEYPSDHLCLIAELTLV